jgi:hypothetical protein
MSQPTWPEKLEHDLHEIRANAKAYREHMKEANSEGERKFCERMKDRLASVQRKWAKLQATLSPEDLSPEEFMKEQSRRERTRRGRASLRLAVIALYLTRGSHRQEAGA